MVFSQLSKSKLCLLYNSNTILINPGTVTLGAMQRNKEIQSMLGFAATTDLRFNLLLLIQVSLNLWPRSRQETEGENVEFNQGTKTLGESN